MECHSIRYGKQTIDFSVVRRERATLEIAVEPDLRVVIAAPLDASIEAIKAKITKRAPWIKRQQRFFDQYLPRTPERNFIPGETHLYLGRQYRLKVEHSSEERVKLIRGFIWVFSRKPECIERTKALVNSWYRDRAHQKFGERLSVCQERFSDPAKFAPSGLIIRDLKHRWGSMSAASRLLLNRRLIEAPVDAIDYVITHELCHIQVPNHSAAFFDLLKQVMPDWQLRKSRLEKSLS